MVKNKLTIIFFTLLCCCCNNGDKRATMNRGTNAPPTVAILPLGDIDSSLIKTLKKEFSDRLKVDFVIIPKKGLPVTAFYKPRQRYIADTLLTFLSRTNDDRFDKIIGVTTKDISTRKGDIENWGILGLGNCPGEACVISTFRAGKNKVATKDFIRRMTTLGLHELGHTYGLEHCPESTCLMVDAEGKMKLDNGDSYCDKCRKWLVKQGVLK